jgi:multidrug efflux pump subunit AcrA (membrane-fusion protein)
MKKNTFYSILRVTFLSVFAVGAVYTSFIFYSKDTAHREKEYMRKAVVIRGSLSKKITLRGSIEPYLGKKVFAAANGRIDEIDINIGSRVRKAEELAWISSRERISFLEEAKKKIANSIRGGNSQEVAQVRTKMQAALKDYPKLPVTSPIDGNVARCLVEPGQFVSTGTALFILSNGLCVTAEISDTDRKEARPGQKAEFLFGNIRCAGKTVSVLSEPGKSAGEKRYTAVFVPDTKLPNWSAGRETDISFFAERKNILLLPLKAVKTEAGKSWVFLPGNKVPRPVVTGIYNDKFMEILDGLKEKDMVVMRNTEDSPLNTPSR